MRPTPAIPMRTSDGVMRDLPVRFNFGDKATVFRHLPEIRTALRRRLGRSAPDQERRRVERHGEPDHHREAQVDRVHRRENRCHDRYASIDAPRRWTSRWECPLPLGLARLAENVAPRKAIVGAARSPARRRRAAVGASVRSRRRAVRRAPVLSSGVAHRPRKSPAGCRRAFTRDPRAAAPVPLVRIVTQWCRPQRRLAPVTPHAPGAWGPCSQARAATSVR